MAAQARMIQERQIALYEAFIKLKGNVDEFSASGRWKYREVRPIDNPVFQTTLVQISKVASTAEMVKAQISTIPSEEESLYDQITCLQKIHSSFTASNPDLEDRLASINELAQQLSTSMQFFKNEMMRSSAEKPTEVAGIKDLGLPFNTNLVRLLANENIQEQDNLKAALSMVMVAGLEFLVFRFVEEGRAIFETTHVDMKRAIDEVISTLPKSQVRARFELKCAQALLKKLEIGEGKWKKLAKASAPELIAAIVNAGISDPAAMIQPVIRLAIAIYQNMESRWYKDIWAMRWLTGALGIESVESLEKMRPLIQRSATNYKLAIKVSDLFASIIRTSSDLDLKERVLLSSDNETITLFKLAEIEPTGVTTLFSRNSFWQARYITMINLTNILKESSDDSLRKNIFTLLVKRVLDEPNGFAQQYAKNTYKDYIAQFPDFMEFARSYVLDRMDQKEKEKKKQKWCLENPPALAFSTPEDLEQEQERTEELHLSIERLNAEIEYIKQELLPEGIK